MGVCGKRREADCLPYNGDLLHCGDKVKFHNIERSSADRRGRRSLRKRRNKEGFPQGLGCVFIENSPEGSFFGSFFSKKEQTKMNGQIGDFAGGNQEKGMLSLFRWLSTADTRFFRAEWRWKNPGVNERSFFSKKRKVPNICCIFGEMVIY